MVTGSVVHRVNGLSGASDLLKVTCFCHFIFHKGSDNLRGRSWWVSRVSLYECLVQISHQHFKVKSFTINASLYVCLLYGSHTSLSWLPQAVLVSLVLPTIQVFSSSSKSHSSKPTEDEAAVCGNIWECQLPVASKECSTNTTLQADISVTEQWEYNTIK